MEKLKPKYPKLHFKDISGKLSWILILIACFLLVLFFCFSDYLQKNYHYWREHSTAFITAFFAILFGIYTVGSYVVARRVEQLIHDDFSSYEEFLRRVGKLFTNIKKGSTIKMMFTFPSFELSDNIKNLKENENDKNSSPLHLNVKLDDLIDDIYDRNLSIHIVQESANLKNNFIEEMKKIHREIDDDRIKEETEHIEKLSKLIKNSKRHSITESELPLPFHLVIVNSEHAIYVSLPKKWKEYAKTGACKGYSTSDPYIISSFQQIFALFSR